MRPYHTLRRLVILLTEGKELVKRDWCRLATAHTGGDILAGWATEGTHPRLRFDH